MMDIKIFVILKNMLGIFLFAYFFNSKYQMLYLFFMHAKLASLSETLVAPEKITNKRFDALMDVYVFF